MTDKICNSSTYRGIRILILVFKLWDQSSFYNIFTQYFSIFSLFRFHWFDSILYEIIEV